MDPTRKQPSPPTERDLALWLSECGASAEALISLCGDVSERRYYRARLSTPLPGVRGHQIILAWYPETMVDRLDAFEQTSALLSRHGIRVPEVLHTDPARRLMAIEDVGDHSLEQMPIDEPETVELYRRAAAMIGQIAALPGEVVASLNPPLGAELLTAELEQTRRLFLAESLRSEPALSQALDEALAIVVDELARAPRLPCHRDFMARNLIVHEGELVLLDHQDLRLGPTTYDLASLLYDSSRLSAGPASEMVRSLVPDREATFARACVQRMLKIVGTFEAFARRGDDRYLCRIPGALDNAVARLGDLPEGAEVAPQLARVWRS